MENVLLHPSGHIKITDFGLALENAIPGVMYNKICGTPNYMAPEVKQFCRYWLSYFIWTKTLHIRFH